MIRDEAQGSPAMTREETVISALALAGLFLIATAFVWA
jgi:hypothetical protein